MRIAVLGTGAMGANHARVLHELNHLAAVVETDPSRRDMVAGRYGVPGYASLDDLVASTDRIDAIVVATPTTTHAEAATRAFKAGWHVLVEKPIASTLEEADAMLAAAKTHDRVLAVGHIERHNPAVAFTRHALASGRHGKIITVTARRVSRFAGRIQDVGCILDIGIHDLDILCLLVGARPESVFAVGGSHQAGGREDHATIVLSFPDEVHGAVEVNWLTPRRVRQFTVTCEEAFIEGDFTEQTVAISHSKAPSGEAVSGWPVPTETTVESVELVREEPLRRELADFVESIEHGRTPVADGQAGRDALAIAEAAVRSLKSGRPERPRYDVTLHNEVEA